MRSNCPGDSYPGWIIQAQMFGSKNSGGNCPGGGGFHGGGDCPRAVVQWGIVRG